MLFFDLIGTASLECSYQWRTDRKKHNSYGTPVLYGKLNTNNYVSKCEQKCIDNHTCTRIDFVDFFVAAVYSAGVAGTGNDPWCWIRVPGTRVQYTKQNISFVSHHCPKAITGQWPYYWSLLFIFYCVQKSFTARILLARKGRDIQWSNYEGARGAWPPEKPGGPFETPGFRGYKGPLKAPPPVITRQIQYMIATYQYHSKHCCFSGVISSHRPYNEF